MEMETIKKLKEIINDGANLLTKEKKAFVFSVADELGVPYQKKTKCRDCVIDVALKCYTFLNENKQNQRIRLKDGVRIFVNGTPINEAVCSTTEECEWALSIGTPRYYFDFLTDENNESDKVE